ncbi:LacI family transcriptional regulator [Isoptericola sp. NEAU-Y5]|uniref:LacI family transcriptional regulator n=1 Tax=Isoptericola luteus TaxID=2879484 RepID=A0ABS7ZH18_9MICO|nr:LacI family DNA-binding transcriptional regulator [Isoptericola sp. NEAU-Y5]MCA5893134.1 LacI family transcriptional regulator [Isoptericola sp. NEAU-Y5]
MARVTSADVAREAGVSRTTVSYVLNDTPGASVSRVTRERIRETATRLGYAPSAAARTLRRGRSDLVVAVLPDWPTGSVVDTLLDHLTDVLATRGLFVLVHHHRDSRSLADLWRAVTPHTVVGLAPFAPDDLRTMQRAGIRVVGTAQNADETSFDVAQRGIGALQAEHLVAAGHTRIAYARPDDPRLGRFADGRLAGVRAACAAAALEVPAAVPVPAGEPAAAAVAAWRDAGVTAVAAYNDDVALAVLAGAAAHGLRVPDELAVIGVDDAPAGRVAAPPLTTVAQPVAQQSEHLAASVLAAIDGADAPPWPDDPALVVARGSA